MLFMNAKTLSIIIPVLNEDRFISDVVNSVENLEISGVDKEVIIIDDGSTDSTHSVAEKLAKRWSNIKLLRNKKNRGKGYSVRRGIRESSGDVIIIQDADLEYNPEDIPKVVEPILRGDADVVYGSRFLRRHKPGYTLFYIGNLILSFMTGLLYGASVSDMETCYKAFSRHVADNIKLKANRFDFEPEITAKILKQGFAIEEVPIKYAGRSFKEGKKITVWDGLIALWSIIRYRFMK